MANMPVDPDKAITDLKSSLSKDEIGKAMLLASDYSDASLLVAASLHAQLGLKSNIKEDIEESIRGCSKSFADKDREKAKELGLKYQASTLKLAALYAWQSKQSGTKTFLPTRPIREVCICCEHEECECHSDQLPRNVTMYTEYVAPPVQEVQVLCDPCRKRLEDAGEIRVAQAAVLPIEPSQPPVSAND